MTEKFPPQEKIEESRGLSQKDIRDLALMILASPQEERAEARAILFEELDEQTRKAVLGVLAEEHPTGENADELHDLDILAEQHEEGAIGSAVDAQVADTEPAQPKEATPEERRARAERLILKTPTAEDADLIGKIFSDVMTEEDLAAIKKQREELQYAPKTERVFRAGTAIKEVGANDLADKKESWDIRAMRSALRTAAETLQTLKITQLQKINRELAEKELILLEKYIEEVKTLRIRTTETENLAIQKELLAQEQQLAESQNEQLREELNREAGMLFAAHPSLDVIHDQEIFFIAVVDQDKSSALAAYLGELTARHDDLLTLADHADNPLEIYQERIASGSFSPQEQELVTQEFLKRGLDYTKDIREAVERGEIENEYTRWLAQYKQQLEEKRARNRRITTDKVNAGIKWARGQKTRKTWRSEDDESALAKTAQRGGRAQQRRKAVETSLAKAEADARAEQQGGDLFAEFLAALDRDEFFAELAENTSPQRVAQLRAQFESLEREDITRRVRDEQMLRLHALQHQKVEEIRHLLVGDRNNAGLGMQLEQLLVLFQGQEGLVLTSSVRKRVEQLYKSLEEIPY